MASLSPRRSGNERGRENRERIRLNLGQSIKMCVVGQIKRLNRLGKQ